MLPKDLQEYVDNQTKEAAATFCQELFDYVLLFEIVALQKDEDRFFDFLFDYTRKRLTKRHEEVNNIKMPEMVGLSEGLFKKVIQSLVKEGSKRYILL